MADYKKIDLQIGTEEQFEEKKLSLPVGTLVGRTDPIHESELDTDLQTKINEVSNKLTAPATPTTDSAVTMLADGTVGTKPLTSITGKTEVYVGSTTPTNPDEILWIDPNGTSGGGGSSGGGKLYMHRVSFTFDTAASYYLTIDIPTNTIEDITLDFLRNYIQGYLVVCYYGPQGIGVVCLFSPAGGGISIYGTVIDSGTNYNIYIVYNNKDGLVLDSQILIEV